MKKTVVGMMASVFCCACLLADVASAANTGRANDRVDYADYYDVFASHVNANKASSSHSNANMNQSNARSGNLSRRASSSASQSRQEAPARLSRLSRSNSFAGRTNDQRSPSPAELRNFKEPIADEVESPATLSLSNSSTSNSQSNARSGNLRRTRFSASQSRQKAPARLSGLSRNNSFAARTYDQRSPSPVVLGKSSAPMTAVIDEVEVSAPRNNALSRSTLPDQDLSLSDSFDHPAISVSTSHRAPTPILDENDATEGSKAATFPVKPRYSHRAAMFGKDRGYIANLGTYMKHTLGNDFEATCNINSNGLRQVPAALETLKQYFKTITKMHRMPFSASEANKLINHDIASVNKFLSAMEALLVGSKDSVFAKAYKQLSSQQEFRLLTPTLAQRFREAISEEQSNLSTNLLARTVDGIVETVKELEAIFEELKPFDLQESQSSENEVIYQLGEKINTILEMWKQQFAQDSGTAVQDADLTNYISQNSPKAKMQRAANTMKAGINTGISRAKGVFGRHKQESDVNSRAASATSDQQQGGFKGMLNRIRRH